MLMRMLESILQAAGRIQWQALILYADIDDNARKIPTIFPQTVILDENEFFPKRKPSWPEMMQFLLEKTNSPWFIYASDDIVFMPNAFVYALDMAQQYSGLAGGVAMAYRNASAPPDSPWSQYGIDLTLGHQILINYGLINTNIAKSLGGFDTAYNFYCADGDLCLRILRAGFRIIPCIDAKVLHDDIIDMKKKQNINISEKDIALYKRKWSKIYYDIDNVNRILEAKNQMNKEDIIYKMYKNKLYSPGNPLKIHLGCGEKYLDGYINIDYPPKEHAVMRPKADMFADITQLQFPDNTVDEIRLHHVFEHFSRVEALGLLIRWHRWLRVGGKIHIETPDLEGSAKTILSNAPFKHKTAAARHLAGDQTDHWAYHVDHWFPERFAATLSHLGFEDITISQSTWDHPPYLANVTAIAIKTHDIPEEKLLQAADELLWLSIVAPSEMPMYEIWKTQLRNFLAHHPIHAPSISIDDTLQQILPLPADAPPTEEIHDFNQRRRDQWVQAKAATISPGAMVLDVGAGTCPYKEFFSHCHYFSQDFKKYQGIKLGGKTEYGDIDIESDITAIPIQDKSFDVILCTEVLEHVIDPQGALREMIRILKPGGKLLLIAPLGSGVHQAPFHYYGGFTRYFYERVLPSLGMHIVEIIPNGGFFALLAQECARVSWTFEQHHQYHGDRSSAIKKLFHQYLPQYLYAMDKIFKNEDFTTGYFIEAVKK